MLSFAKYLLPIIGATIIFLWKTNHVFKYHLKFFLYYGAWLILGIVVIPLNLLLVKPCRPENLSRITGPVATLYLKYFGVQYDLLGAENLQSEESYVLMANHQSSLDLIGMLKYLPDKMTILAKKELKYFGTFGIAAWLSGLVFVDRSDKALARKTMDETVKEIVKNKIKLWVFPEGTRHMGNDFLSFKKGGFHIAIKAQIPIVPLVYSSYANFLNNKRKYFEPGKVILTALPPIKTTGLAVNDIDQLMDKVRNQMLKVYQETSKETLENYNSLANYK